MATTIGIAKICENPHCKTGADGSRAVFLAKRSFARFCSAACRHAFHKTANQWQPHACGYCGNVHDPDEPAVLDALERTIRSSEVVTIRVIEAFIARRRAILSPP